MPLPLCTNVDATKLNPEQTSSHYNSTIMTIAFAFTPCNPYNQSTVCVRNSTFTRSPLVPSRISHSRRRPRYARVTPTAVTYPTPVGVSGECSTVVRSLSTLPELFQHLGNKYPDYTALIDQHRPIAARTTLTYAELNNRIKHATAALRRLDINSGDVIALFAENSHRWLIADQAIMACGAATAVRGADAPIPELDYIYVHSGSRALIVESPAVLKRLVDGGFDATRPEFIVMLFGAPQPGYPFDIILFDDLIAKGENPTDSETVIVGGANDTATILYTSGTTGKPKGVVLQHSNILHQVGNLSIGSIDPVPGEVFVSVLPCWHIFERTAAYYCFSKAMIVVYSNKRRFREDLINHRPQVLVAVPRVFENLHATVMYKLKSASEVRKKIFNIFTALSLAFIYASRRMRGLSLKHMSNGGGEVFARAIAALKFLILAPLYLLANLLVWKKIRAATGGRVRLCVCGGGMLAGHLEDFFEAARINICVGYGLTETSPVITNRFAEHNVRGSAGLLMPGTQLKIVDPETGAELPKGSSGVIHAKGPQVFSHYHHNEEATQKAFDKQQFFDTGDLGYVAASGDLVVNGRSKDVIVLSNGENVEPAPIEDAILSSPLIDQVMLVGQDERSLGALVVPRLDALLEHEVIDDGLHKRAHELLKQREGVDMKEIRALEMEMGLHPDVYGKLIGEISELNESRENYSRNERIAGFRVVLTPFSVENGMMTQTLKIKKQIVADKLHSHIRSMYDR